MLLAGCAAPPRVDVPSAPGTRIAPSPSIPSIADDGTPLPSPRVQGKSRWLPVRWSDLPGVGADALHEAWNAWIRSCERPAPAHAALCPEVRRLSIASGEEQRAWLLQRLQPYRVEPLQPGAEPLLTGYYEPLLDASRVPTARQQVPLYLPPADLNSRRPWYTRQEIDTLAQPRAALRGREIAYVADPLDALSLQIQGSGRARRRATGA
jgi:membrane-bound lytic murein transglycosylase A